MPSISKPKQERKFASVGEFLRHEFGPLTLGDLGNLQDSGLNRRTIRDNELRTEGGALVFPYRRLDGSMEGFARTRPHKPRTRDGKTVKYEQPKGKPPRAYFPAASLAKLNDGESPIYITEGEKKALALSQLDGLAAIGLGGIWCWKRKGTDELIEDLAAVELSGRSVYIVFDYDEKPRTRRNTAVAAKRLAEALREAGADEVRVVDLPPGQSGEKQGIDDYLKANRDASEAALARLVRDDRSDTDCELWKTPDGTGYATVMVNGHAEHMKIQSKLFRHWLAKKNWDRNGTAMNSNALSDALQLHEARAAFEGNTYEVYLRTASAENKFYLDLLDDEWRAIEIDCDGWRICERPPVRFRRAKACLPLPEPEKGGSLELLRKYVNVRKRDWPLLLSWLVVALRPTGPYPILKLQGEQGSAKTTTAIVLRSLVDPNDASARRPPKREEDLMLAAMNAWVISLDNLSYVDTYFSDALCRLACGAALARRTLYSDDDETIFKAQRPIILNGIEDVGTRSDLLDRCVVLELPTIEPAKRRTEKEFWAAFKIDRPKILGALLDAVSHAIRNLPEVEAKKAHWPRMADFATWATAAERGLGLEVGEFERRYADNRSTASQTALESSPVVDALQKVLKRSYGRWEGTATELLAKLSIGVDTRGRHWPKNPRALSGILRRLAQDLRSIGVECVQTRIGSGNNRQKIWRIGPTGSQIGGSGSQTGRKKSGVATREKSPETQGKVGRKGPASPSGSHGSQKSLQRNPGERKGTAESSFAKHMRAKGASLD